MNLVDAAVGALLVLGILAGTRAGLLGPILGLIGAAIGFAVALLLASFFRDQLANIEQPLRAVTTFVALGAFVLVGEASGAAIGTKMSREMRGMGLRPLDAVGGAVVGAAHVILFVWLVSGMLMAGVAPGIGAAARESATLRLIEERLPPPTVVAGLLLTLLDTTDLPPLFAGIEPSPAPPVDLPVGTEVRALADSALASTALVTSVGCGAGIAVGSGFFVSATHLVTNAHVVAGGAQTTVTISGAVHAAAVVAFDPDADGRCSTFPPGGLPPSG
jgi:uncharacterized membrane protein required for colicin V production